MTVSEETTFLFTSESVGEGHPGIFHSLFCTFFSSFYFC